VPARNVPNALELMPLAFTPSTSVNASKDKLGVVRSAMHLGAPRADIFSSFQEGRSPTAMEVGRFSILVCKSCQR
jgi:hypothetical protein